MKKRSEAARVRLLHTSDWHLGRRFFGKSLLHDQAYVLDQTINLVRDLHPDVCLVAGDVFEQRRPTEDALSLFYDTISRLIDLGTTVVVLAGPSDDFSKLHLHARWVRQQGLHLYSEPSQVLSPLTLKGARDDFPVSMWCLPYARAGSLTSGSEHPAQFGRALIETTIQRIDPTSVNILAGYLWAQGAGRRAELGALIAPGGQPVEHRLLDFFDYSALGGSHDPLSLGADTIRYCGGLLPLEVEGEADSLERSVTLTVIEAKGKVVVDHFPLRPRRAFRVLSGSVDELLAQGKSQRGDDLLILRSNELELSLEERTRLRSLGTNVVSVETAPSLSEGTEFDPRSTSLVELVRQFHLEMRGESLSEDSLALLTRVQEQL